ncbi:hypothetical protein EZS27_027391, partial [termite gut metagenome]
MMVLVLSSCGERVKPNYIGVKMENWGKEGKKDFKNVKGWVWTWFASVDLYQVGLYEQKGEAEKNLDLIAADNTEFHIFPVYTYKAIEDSAVSIVFNNKQVTGGGSKFLKSVEDEILDPAMKNIISSEIRTFTTEQLMETGGSLAFENHVDSVIRAEFKRRGFRLEQFVARLTFTDAVIKVIDDRNKVNQNIGVLTQQIEEQKKRNELAQLKKLENQIQSEGLTKQILTNKFIETWGGKTVLYPNPTFLKVLE